MSNTIYICSKCGADVPDLVEGASRICPNCGWLVYVPGMFVLNNKTKKEYKDIDDNLRKYEKKNREAMRGS